MYIVKFYYTDAVIAIVSDFEDACRICKENEDSVVTRENGSPLYYNLDIPFC